ncbi:hypothetical protein ACQKRQ_41025 [Paraburkholderia sp. NPDC080076]|jgi:hypothetical protein|uniref:hypothetical protein n=1 Tax=Paraburkholderia sp. NPDC080076 TaxID=3390605 RepID=UPI003CFBEF84
MPDLKVMPIREVSLSDIVGMLQRLADAIEHGEHEGIRGAVVMLDSHAMSVFGFGDAPPAVAGELLACAHYKLVRARLMSADVLEL